MSLVGLQLIVTETAEAFVFVHFGHEVGLLDVVQVAKVAVIVEMEVIGIIGATGAIVISCWLSGCVVVVLLKRFNLIETCIYQMC